MKRCAPSSTFYIVLQLMSQVAAPATRAAAGRVTGEPCPAPTKVRSLLESVFVRSSACVALCGDCQIGCVVCFCSEAVPRDPPPPNAERLQQPQCTPLRDPHAQLRDHTLHERHTRTLNRSTSHPLSSITLASHHITLHSPSPAFTARGRPASPGQAEEADEKRRHDELKTVSEDKKDKRSPRCA